MLLCYLGKCYPRENVTIDKFELGKELPRQNVTYKAKCYLEAKCD